MQRYSEDGKQYGWSEGGGCSKKKEKGSVIMVQESVTLRKRENADLINK